ncbi:MAG: SPOR domain-containing protein [Candidatus Cyclobacteriaceae bacterium M3_2C_046]
MEEKDYNSEQEGGWDSDYNRNKEENDADDFGLPDVSYDPMEKDQSEDDFKNENENYKEERYFSNPSYNENKGGSKAGAIIAFLLVFLGVLFAVYWFLFRDTTEPVESTTTEVVQEPVEQPVIQEPEPQVQNTEPVEEPVEETTPATPETGEMTTISSPTGRYYIVVGSFIDDDLAMDLGNQLAAKGMNSYLIEPSGDNKFYRLGLGNFDSWNQALNRLEDLKTTFDNEIWVLKF